MYAWEDKFSVGIQSIDIQHKQLFKLISDLLEEMKLGKAGQVINPIIQELEKYAVIHFRKEEFFFERFNYPEKVRHMAEHQVFIQKVDSLKSSIKSGNTSVAFELLNFLKLWIEQHILVSDKEYSECFRQNGLK